MAKRSDGGERRKLGKASEKTRGYWGEGESLFTGVPSPVRPFLPRLFRLLFSAPLPYSSRLSPLSERLEQAKVLGVSQVCSYHVAFEFYTY